MVGHRVPFVDRDDQRPPFVDDMAGDGEILLVEDRLAVQHQDHHLRQPDGVQRVAGRQLLDPVGDLGAAAHARGVDQPDGMAAIGPVDRDGVPGHPGLRAGDDPLIFHQRVQQGRFSDIRASDDRELDDPCGGLALLLLRHGLFAAVVGKQLLGQFGHAEAMLGGDRHRLAEPEFMRLDQPGLGGRALAFVGHQHKRRFQPPQGPGEVPVHGRDAGAGVEHQQRDIGLRQRPAGLLQHIGLDTVGRHVLQTGGIDDGECERADPAFADPAVAGDAGLVVDQRLALADQPVEQGRLAHIGAADDGDGEGHGPSCLSLREDSIRGSGRWKLRIAAAPKSLAQEEDHLSWS